MDDFGDRNYFMGLKNSLNHFEIFHHLHEPLTIFLLWSSQSLQVAPHSTRTQDVDANVAFLDLRVKSLKYGGKWGVSETGYFYKGLICVNFTNQYLIANLTTHKNTLDKLICIMSMEENSTF